MKRLFTILLGSLFLNIAGALNAHAQVEVVQAVKNDLVSRHINLSGPCGAFEITKRVAWILRAQGVGLLDKPGGNNCQGYSVDYVVFPDMSGRDILGDGGGENIPQWSGEPNEPAGAFAGRWRAPFDPGDTITPAPSPSPTPAPQPPPASNLDLLPVILAELRMHEAEENLERVKAEAFRQAVGNEYAKFGKFVAKYVLPAVAGFFGGKAIAK